MKNKISFLIILALLAVIVLVFSACGETNEPEHVHTEQIMERVEPTCTEPGLTEGKKCSDCGEIMVAQETIDALGHKEETLAQILPTCTESGLTEGKKCSVCNEVLIEQKTIKPSHKVQTFSKVLPTCTETGLTEGKKCTVCGEITVSQETIEPLGHKYENSYTCSICGYVSAIESIGLSFSYNKETDTYIVTGIGECKDTDIVIPYTYENKLVTIIGDYAFSGCSSLTSIIIPDSVISIGNYAFADCDSLTSIDVDENNTEYKSIDGNLYSKDGTILIQYAIGKKDTSFIVPDSVTSIGKYAFYYCDSLTSATIGNSVTSIGEDAFHGCGSLTIYCEAASKPSGWDSDWNYSKCPVVWDYKNNDVADDGYVYTVINGIRYGIKDNYATVVRQPKNIVEANILSAITYKDTIYPVTSIGNYAFKDCDSLTSVTIGNSVTSIGEYAFSSCDSLISVTIGNSVTSIGDYAFEDCDSLTCIVIPDSVTSIGNSAFYYCDSLSSIVIPDSVTSIGDEAFCWCDRLTNITVDENNINYKSIDGNLYSKDGTILIQYAIGKKDTSFIVPDSVTSIESYAFAYCTSMTSIVITDSVTSIGDKAFYLCGSYIEIPDIGRAAFEFCSRLVIYCEVQSQPNGWSSRWNYTRSQGLINSCPVVWDCNNNDVADDGYIYTVIDGVRYGIKNNVATVVTQSINIVEANIPSTITYKDTVYPVTGIGNYAFADCDSLTSIDVDENNTEYKSIDGNLYSKDGTILIQYAIGKKDTSFIVPNSVTGIEDRAFYGCDSLTSIVIPDSVTSIGNFAFKGCSSLTSIVIPDSVTSIGYSAFEDCDSLTSIVIPDSVISIGEYAFYNCDSLTILYCEAQNKPSGWASYWNKYGFWDNEHCPVVWGHKHSYTDGECVCGMKQN